MDVETIRKAIPAMQSQVQELERQLLEKKRTVNGLCVAAGEPPTYADVDPTANSSNFGIQSDSYFGKPLAKAVRDVLERRKAVGLGAAPLNTIFDLMKFGGFRFDARNDKTARRSLAIALSKNPAFFRLPGGDSIGLSEWYGDLRNKSDGPVAKKKTKARRAKATSHAENEDEYRNDFARKNGDESATIGKADVQANTRKYVVPK